MNKLQKNMRRFGTKNLNEQINFSKKGFDKIPLPDGEYLGVGSGYKYQITDLKGKDLGYQVESERGVRGLVEDDPVTITDGIPTSKTWGVGGIITRNLY